MNIAVLLAGGSGLRMKAQPTVKQHLVIGGHQIIEYTLTAFTSCPQIDAVLVVSNADFLDQVKQLQAKFPKLKWVIPGGDTRSMSAYQAVLFLADICTPHDKIVFSDAVRPCITHREIREILDCLDQYQAATTGIEAYETILKTQAGEIRQIISRDGVLRQTSPEGYRYQILRQLYLDTAMDEVRNYANIGVDQLFSQNIPVGIVKSTSLNFKITTPEDLRVFRALLERSFEEIITEF